MRNCETSVSTRWKKLRTVSIFCTGILPSKINTECNTISKINKNLKRKTTTRIWIMCACNATFFCLYIYFWCKYYISLHFVSFDASQKKRNNKSMVFIIQLLIVCIFVDMAVLLVRRKKVSKCHVSWIIETVYTRLIGYLALIAAIKKKTNTNNAIDVSCSLGAKRKKKKRMKKNDRKQQQYRSFRSK